VAPSCDGRSCLHLEEFLDGTSRCQIYADRPPVCRVDDNKPAEQDWTSFYEETAKRCNELQEEQGIPESFRVRL
jgi:Fe-S-cluster containining protein